MTLAYGRHWFEVYRVVSLDALKFLLPLSLRIFLNWSLFSLLAVLDHRLLSPYEDHLLPHLSKLQTVLFCVRYPAFGINSLTLSVSLIHILVFHLLTTLPKSDPHCHHHLCHHQSLLLFVTPDWHCSQTKFSVWLLISQEVASHASLYLSCLELTAVKM